MGGVVDCGVGTDTKASPRRAAIDESQTQMPMKADGTVERIKEFEFLVNGGDVLTYKVSQAGSISVQSTSIRDQLAEQYIISEAKSSFALAPSPHGDSVESSGRPGGSSGREPNIADNLLLFDGENSNIGGDRNLKFNRKRGNGGPLEQCSQIDGCDNPKEADDSVTLGFKRQAYARRNRSRSSRDSTHVGSTDVSPADTNKLTNFPSSHSGSLQGLLCGKLEDHALSSISNSKPNGNIVSKTSVAKDQLDMELDTVQTRHTCSDTLTGGAPEGEAETKPSDNNQDSHEVPEKDHNGAALQSSNYIENKALLSDFLSATLGSIVDKEIKTNEKVDCHDITSKNVKVINDDLRRKVLNVKKNTETDPSLVMMSADTDGKAKTDECSILGIADRSSVGECIDHQPFQEALSVPDKNCVSDKSQCVAIDAPATVNDESRAVLPTPEYSSIKIKDEVKLRGSKTDLQTEVRPSKNPGGVQLNGEVIMNVDRLQENCFDDTSCSADKAGMNTSNLAELSSQHANATLLKKGSITNSEFQNGPAVQLKLAKKAREDAILKEARIIEANLRRAGNNSLSSVSLEKRKKCHWDFVLEEMAWMANDFMQERVWKMVAASQVSRTIVNGGLFMFQEENMHRKQRRIARTVAKAIMHFWHSADIFRSGGKELIGTHGSDLCKTWKVNGVDAEKHKASNYNEAEHSVQILKPAVQGYAVRFLNYISSTSIDPVLAEAPTTPETNDAGIIGVPWEDQHSEESLFYAVPPGAMCKYRESMELAYLKKTNNASHKDEWELSNCDSVADGPRQNAYEEDASENCTYFFPGATERGLSLKYANRKKKILQHKSNAGRLYAVGSDLLYENRAEGKFGNQPLMITGKRPSSTVNVGSVPTKRVRSAARQRASPFEAGVAGSMQMTSKTDVSSGDTNSFQDDQSSPYGVSHHPRRNLEVETTANFDRQLSFDGCEISSKSKKKKKPKHLGYKNSLNLTGSGALILPGKGSLYEQKLLPDSMIRLEQRDHLKKRLESQRFESNGNLSVGQYAQHVAKKPKLLKQFPESSSDAIVPFTGSVPSPVASQMSNMSGPTKFIKMNKDRGRKSKGMKVAAGQSGSANPWSNFEEQALVVLVHDLGTHWELISDAMNSTLLFKRVFRSPSECKERHKILMESSVDGADSAEDSGSSQQYRSTLPGIPKGSARQLFQRLQAPVEEDTLKAHFEKIISIGQKLHSFRTLNDTQAPEKITQAHSSHVVALSQMCPNNLSRSVVLTPLDLCDTTTSNPDAPTHGYQGSQTNSLPITSHQSSSSLVIPISGGSTMLQGSPSLVLSNGLPSPSRSLSGQARDSQRYGMPRPNSLPADDQQRMQQYSQMISGRSIQQPNMSIPGNLSVGGERSVRMLPGANGMGMMCGINRGMPVPRPGFQGMNSPGMINMVSTGGMLSGNALGMQNPTNVHPSSVSGPGNSMLRPRDTLQMARPGQNTDEHRQMMMQELQHQVSQGNCQSVAPFSGISAPYSNATVAPPVQAFPVQNQQPHQMPQQSNMFGNPHHPHIPANNHSSSQQQAYAMRAAKERQVQQRMMPQPQHPFAGSNMVSSLPSGSQIQQQVQSSSSGISVPSSQAQHKQQQMQRSAQSGNGMPNPMMKQRQRQQVQQQQPRPQQQQRPISQQQAKMMKGLGRGGTMLMHQNLSVEGSHPGGLSTAPKNQVSDKHPIQQSQGFFPSSSVLNTPLPQSANQPKMYPRPLPQTSKQMSLMPSMSDNINQGSTQLPPGHTLVASHQPPVSASLPLTSQPQQRQSNQSQQNMQRLTLHQNRQINSDSRMQSSTDQIYANQMIPATSSPQCADSSAPVVSTGMQWKPEPSYDISQPIQTSHLAGSPQENMIGTEALMSSSNQGLGQRQFSGSLPLHKHNIGGQWQQQPQPQQQQQSQLQHRQGGAPGNLYARPSNSGAG